MIPLNKANQEKAPGPKIKSELRIPWYSQHTKVLVLTADRVLAQQIKAGAFGTVFQGFSLGFFFGSSGTYFTISAQHMTRP